MTLIADSGSTKTDWRLDGRAIETLGINPVRDSEESIAEVTDCLPEAEVGEIYFYGAGCIEPYNQRVKLALQRKYPTARVTVESDILGAARALCGREEGIACILGTGSNSCLYDGEKIIANVPPLGYVLGDEGSGSALGRRLAGDALKGLLGKEMKEELLSELRLTQTDIIDKVYRQPMPNRFLASLVPFLLRRKELPQINNLLTSEFRRFFRRNVVQYERPDLPVNLAGGVAHSFSGEIAEAARLEGLAIGITLKAPADRIAEYHKGEAEQS